MKLYLDKAIPVQSFTLLIGLGVCTVLFLMDSLFSVVWEERPVPKHLKLEAEGIVQGEAVFQSTDESSEPDSIDYNAMAYSITPPVSAIRESSLALIRQGDAVQAVSLLQSNQELSSLANAINQDLFNELAQAIDRKLQAEYNSLRQYWLEASPKAQELMLPGIEARKTFLTYLKNTKKITDWQAFKKAVSPMIGVMVLIRVYHGFGRDKQSLKTLSHWFLLNEFSEGGLYRRLFEFGVKQPNKPQYSDFFTLTDNFLSKEIIIPAIGACLEAESENFRSLSAGGKNWALKFFGASASLLTPFIKAENTDPFETKNNFDLKKFCASVSPLILHCWAKSIYKNDLPFKISREMAKRNSFLKNMFTEFSSEQYLTFARHYPEWNKAVMVFEYDKAAQSLKKVDKTLKGYFPEGLKQNLIRDLRKEHSLLLSINWPKFNKHYPLKMNPKSMLNSPESILENKRREFCRNLYRKLHLLREERPHFQTLTVYKLIRIMAKNRNTRLKSE